MTDDGLAPPQIAGYLSSLPVTVLGVILTLLSLLSLVLNTVSLLYFLSHRRTPIALSYIFISLNDMLLLLLTSPLLVAMVTGCHPVLGAGTGCQVWGVVWTIARRISGFLVVWILACRTMTLMSQFKYVRAVNIYGPTASYLVLLVVQALVMASQEG